MRTRPQPARLLGSTWDEQILFSDGIRHYVASNILDVHAELPVNFQITTRTIDPADVAHIALKDTASKVVSAAAVPNSFCAVVRDGVGR